MLTACVEDDTVMCRELTCPPGTICTEIGCRQPEQVEMCSGRQDGEACAWRTEPAICYSQVCEPLVCGDRRLVPPEVCDDGNTTGGDGCAADCRGP